MKTAIIGAIVVIIAVAAVFAGLQMSARTEKDKTPKPPAGEAGDTGDREVPIGIPVPEADFDEMKERARQPRKETGDGQADPAGKTPGPQKPGTSD
ncbi:hypothetical protein GGD81_003177 [Rhodobium orientis]|uniref:Uncharacterized protein n=1 Tax=Rhodobium orientis TaxID=34017 RepID=A0A327JFJ7_9HYPH|nr:hypothetical protein [Rhodobium orientis]MBB4304121.1 hypothetical protein [Rhodobium orientis]MBK5948630.1 hypothetical protein [Rhodobium orientis]RAI24895.1 hypothetical protein CH339_20705 [Rhodobium orientis]